MPPVIVITGPSITRELVDANTLLGRVYDDEVTEDAVDDLLDQAEKTWTLDDIDAGLDNTTARFDGATVYAALLKLADIHDVHVRQVKHTRAIEFGAFGDDSGIRFVSADMVSPNIVQNPAVALVRSLSFEEEADNVVNRIIAIGAGEGNNLFTMQWSTRSIANGDPYDVQTMTGPDGLTLYYIEDSDSVAQYGRVTRVMSFKDIVPIANSPTAFEVASNALYDLGARAMREFKDAPISYSLDALNVSPELKVGQTIRLIFKGFIRESPQGGDPMDDVRVWVDIDEDLIVLEYGRAFDSGGQEVTSLTVSTVDRYLLDNNEVVIGALETLQAFKTGVKFYTYSLRAGPYRESIQFSGSHWFDFKIEYDDNVHALLKTTLRVQERALKSNATAASSGGGSTSGASSTSTTPSGGGSTSGSSSASTTGGGSHQHAVTLGAGASGTPSAATSVGDGTHQHIETGSVTGGPGSTTSVATALHTHGAGNLSGVTATDQGGPHDHSMAHTHSTPNHTHNIDHTHSTPNHTHGLTYGIFEDSLPASPGYKVYINTTDRTSALGGPWNDDFEVDITQYLVDADGHPLWGTNTIQIRKATSSPDAVDVIVEADSLLVATALGVA